MLRAVILAATAATLICMYFDRPRPVQTVEVKYCVISYRAVVKHLVMNPDGEMTEGKSVQWVNGYGPCSLQDIYRHI